jgi:hypothetical protein
LLMGISIFLGLRPIKEKYNLEVPFEAIKAADRMSDPQKVAKWMALFPLQNQINYCSHLSLLSLEMIR